MKAAARDRSSLVVLAITASLVLPAGLTLRSVLHPAILRPTNPNPTPLGYTWSLLLFLVPIAGLAFWFASRPDLRFPRGWWDYRPEAMMGAPIGAWSNLPLEAPAVWIAVTFTTVIVYEVIKIWKALGRRALEAFFGVRG